MNLLGKVIRDLLDERGLTQKELAAQIRLSAASLSQIINGKAKPRQINLTRIMQAICKTPQDEQRIIHAFYNIETLLPDSPKELERPVAPDNLDRVTRYLSMKIASVRLRQRVESILLKVGVPYFRDYIHEPLICDFYLPGHKLILECRANPTRDQDRAEITCGLLRQAFPECEVITVVETPCPFATTKTLELNHLAHTISNSHPIP